MRWAVTGLIEASKRFRRLRGYRDMPTFVASLEALVSGNAAATSAERVNEFESVP